MSTKPSGLLEDLINEAIASAIKQHVVPLIEKVTAEARPQPNVEPEIEHFVSMTEMCEQLKVNRTTVLRRERAGLVPKRKKFPDGRAGWLWSEIEQWFASATDKEPDPVADAERAARIARH